MNLKNILFSLLISILLCMLLIYPNEMLLAAKESILLWYRCVLPSLFPFMVGVNLLFGLGASELLGRIFEPIMGPIFHVPGRCAFAFVMGFLSGYPLGAKITAQLVCEGVISPKEAQKTLSFCNNPGPLFVIGTVATAMLQNPRAGYFILFCIISGSIATGLLFSFLPFKQSFSRQNTIKKHRPNAPMPMGALLGQSVSQSIEIVVQIGGFIMLFGILIQALKITGILHYIGNQALLIGFDASLTQGALAGILEMTNGASYIIASESAFFYKLLFVTGILSFGGLSILAQTLSILSNAPVSTVIYIASKILNALFSMAFVWALYPFCKNTLQKAVPAVLLLEGTAFYRNSIFLSLFFLLCILCFTLFYCFKQKQ